MWPTGVQLRLCVRAKCQQPLEGDILERASTFRAKLTARGALDLRDANDHATDGAGTAVMLKCKEKLGKFQFAHLWLCSLLVDATYCVDHRRNWDHAEPRMRPIMVGLLQSYPVTN